MNPGEYVSYDAEPDLVSELKRCIDCPARFCTRSLAWLGVKFGLYREPACNDPQPVEMPPSAEILEWDRRIATGSGMGTVYVCGGPIRRE